MLGSEDVHHYCCCCSLLSLALIDEQKREDTLCVFTGQARCVKNIYSYERRDNIMGDTYSSKVVP
jgi:hypothetical protein